MMNVLIPVDGSEQSLHTISIAAQLLDKAIAKVLLLTVRVPIATEIPWVQTDDNQALIATLASAENTARQHGLNVIKSDFVTFPSAAEAICAYADEQQVNMIMMGSHGYEGLAKLFMGSVSQDVFKKAKQPVVILRNDKTTLSSVHISHPDQAGFSHLSTAN
jgi:nucleotide-binding universal stress UspA family protein